MFTLFILLLQRLGIILVLAFLLVNVPFFRKLIDKKTRKAELFLIIIFTIFAIISNLTGVEIAKDNTLIQAPFLTGLPQSDSIANTRTLVITVAGIIGGPFVGGFVGFFGGIHRVIQGNFSDFFYIFSSTLVGLCIGFLSKKFCQNNFYPSFFSAALLGLFAELIQMAFVAVFSGLDLVKLIIIPMCLLNSIGVSVFISILNAYLSNEQQLMAVQTHNVLNLTNETLPYFRQGLNINSAHQVCKIIKEFTNFDAVGITDRVNVLAHIGAGEDHHLAGQVVLTDLSKHVISSGETKYAYHRKEIGCPHPDCPLASAIVLPLKVNNKTIGALKMYFNKAESLTPVEENLATGLASIFSGQLALGMAEEQAKLISDAEIKALQAQINPHFFFNAINTVSALMRTNVEQARSSLMQLSTFFRSSLQGISETEIPLEQEKKHVNSYLSLEQTRFPEKYIIDYKISASPQTKVPPFCIQVLVENSIRHAFPIRKNGNKITITVCQTKQNIVIIVKDNGVGIDPELRTRLGQETIASSTGTGTALVNLNRRLIGLYGNESHLQITSSAEGTTIQINIPNNNIATI